MGKVSPYEEITYRHFSIWLGFLYKTLLAVTFFFFMIGVCFSMKTIYANIENWGGPQNEANLMKARATLGFTGRVTLREALESLNPNHPLHELESTKQIWFSYSVGSNIHNYCNKTGLLTVPTLPSILRSFEFIAGAQLFLRLAVLSSFCLRIFLSIVMSHYIWNIFDYRLIIRGVSICLPLLDVTWMTSSIFILCFQTNESRTENTRPYMYYTLPLFATTFLAYALLYTILIGFTFRVLMKLYRFDLNFQKIWLVSFQMCCVMTFVTCFIQVHFDYSAFINSKPCYTDVPVANALMEYGAIASIILFTFSQFHELSSFEGIVTVLKMDFESYFTPNPHYTPAYVYDEISCSSIDSSPQRTNSTSS